MQINSRPQLARETHVNACSNLVVSTGQQSESERRFAAYRLRRISLRGRRSLAVFLSDYCGTSREVRGNDRLQFPPYPDRYMCCINLLNKLYKITHLPNYNMKYETIFFYRILCMICKKFTVEFKNYVPFRIFVAD